MNRTLKSLVSFWLWVGVVLVSFMLIVVSIAADAIPQVAVTLFAVVVFGAEGSAPPLLDGEKQVLTFNLKKEWYEKIKCGDKTIEYREAKPYWEKRFAKEFCSLDVLVCGEKSGANFFVLHPHPCVRDTPCGRA